MRSTSTRILTLLAVCLTACQAINLMMNADGTSDAALSWTPTEHVDYYTSGDVITLLDAVNQLHTDTLGLHDATITKVEKIATDAIDAIKLEVTSDKTAWTTYENDKTLLIEALDP